MTRISQWCSDGIHQINPRLTKLHPMETSKKWPLTRILSPSLSDTPENSETLHGLSFRCPPIPCCWDFKPSPSLMCLELIFQLFVCQLSLIVAVKTQGDDTVRVSLSTVKGNIPRGITSEEQKLIKATGIFSVPQTWLNPVIPMVMWKQLNCTFIAHFSTGYTSLRHETCRGRVPKHLFKSQEFCDAGMELFTALSRFHQLQTRSEGWGPHPRELSWRCKVKINISACSRAFRWVQMQQVRNSLYSIILRCVNAFGFAITHLTPVLCALPNTSIYKQRSRTDGCYTASPNISDLFPVPQILF